MCLLQEQKKEEKLEEELRGIYISYIEISKYLKDKGEAESKKNIDEIIQNIKEFKLNTIILQVRPSCDAMYDSKIFPLSKYLSDDKEYPYDVLEYFLEKSHENNIKLIAWINPYRVSTTEMIEDISKESPVYPYKGTDILYQKEGIYLNPAREETKKLILDGIEEVLNYEVDGILFDDYFYPDSEIDNIEYQEYLKEEEISREEFHLKMVNDLLKEVHKLCEKAKVSFGVSPEGNIENNYEKNFADIKRWLEEKGYVDFIMPQLYYGFENTTKPFVRTSNEWDSFIKNDIPLYPVLALYKVGKIDTYAKDGKEEWINNNNIIKKELIHIRNLKNYEGFVLYRYDNLFGEEEFTKISKEEIENIKKIIN